MPNDTARTLTAAKLQAREYLSGGPAVEARKRLESLRPSLPPLSHSALCGIPFWHVKLRAVLLWNSENGVPSWCFLGRLFHRSCGCAPHSLASASGGRLLCGLSLAVSLRRLGVPSPGVPALVVGALVLRSFPASPSRSASLSAAARAPLGRRLRLVPLLPAWSCLSAGPRCPVLPRSLDSGRTRSRSHSLAQRQARNESVPHGPPFMPHS